MKFCGRNEVVELGAKNSENPHFRSEVEKFILLL